MMQIREIMTSPEASIGISAAINEAVAAMRMKQVDFVAVTNGKTCVGILTDDEITAHLGDPGFDPSITTAGDLIREQDRYAAIIDDRDVVRKVFQNATAEDAFQIMADHDLKYLAVHDDNDVLVGVVARSEVPETSASLLG